ncbi:MAG: aminopeptidase, partial [Gemmatimonadetes bacterium]|nr:aminopeptidase [Gemmatimonadota bacterium]
MRSLVKCASAVLAVGLTAVAAGACGERGRAAVAPGVPLSLAERRTATLTDVRYDVTFSVPDSLSERVRGREVVTFEVGEGAGPLVLDFAAPEGSVLSVRMDGDSLPYVVADQHIEIGRGTPAPGRHTVEIEFLAGDLSLNRSREFLYTLFVPDRARFAFPCFDQPDIKARYRLTLEIPSGWRAVANSAVEAVDSTGARSVYRFAETAPLPTYLFAFAAGQWQLEQAERNGRTFGMYHRETDSAKVALNRDTIFDLHRLAIAFLEDYTGIAYPFDKFDFVAVPAFQYGGMEHPGGVLYRANGLLLDPTATQNQKLGRASVIAHETAHMWFGDLVTMEWFNDVWMKEVFANFMAAKIVQPAFPDINHDLRFLIAHHPAAYEIDRTAGTHAIRQELDNLNEAGTLYGAIIYQKAPIVVRQLEALIGEDTMRQGLREYLQSHRFGNASWPDLIEVLGRLSAVDLASWSRIWVEEGGRPTITTHLSVGQDGRIQSLAFTQADPHGRGRVWVQRLNVLLAYGDTARVVPLEMNAARVEVSEAAGLPAPDFVLADTRGLGYGLFELDPHSRTYLLASLTSVNDPVARGTAWLTLWDGMLEAWVHPDSLL